MAVYIIKHHNNSHPHWAAGSREKEVKPAAAMGREATVSSHVSRCWIQPALSMECSPQATDSLPLLERDPKRPPLIITPDLPL